MRVIIKLCDLQQLCSSCMVLCYGDVMLVPVGNSGVGALVH
jgi:hypothetical protein